MFPEASTAPDADDEDEFFVPLSPSSELHATPPTTAADRASTRPNRAAVINSRFKPHPFPICPVCAFYHSYRAFSGGRVDRDPFVIRRTAGRGLTWQRRLLQHRPCQRRLAQQ